jgi:SP family facilitated glucose transporter-like MFS transporter 8
MQEDSETDAKNKGSIKDVLTSPEAVKAMVISTGLVGFQQMGGICVVLFYTETIFKAVGSTMSANLSSVIVGIVMLIMSFGIMPIMDRAGR